MYVRKPMQPHETNETNTNSYEINATNPATNAKSMPGGRAESMPGGRAEPMEPVPGGQAEAMKPMCSILIKHLYVNVFGMYFDLFLCVLDACVCVCYDILCFPMV